MARNYCILAHSYCLLLSAPLHFIYACSSATLAGLNNLFCLQNLIRFQFIWNPRTNVSPAVEADDDDDDDGMSQHLSPNSGDC